MDPEKTQHVLGTSGQKNDFWRGWDIYLDNENHINMRLINVLPSNLIHVKSDLIIEKDKGIGKRSNVNKRKKRRKSRKKNKWPQSNNRSRRK